MTIMPRLALLASVSTLTLLSPAAAAQQPAAPATTSAADVSPSSQGDETGAQEIVVTGIRASLASALSAKRRAANVIDSISAEDAGKFPEVNVAESLQRVPGVQVVRGFGLGQQIAARGLGPDFTNVLLDGRTLPSDTGAWSADGGGRGRSFNFDVLPADMISRIDVNKTMLPSLTEGGIGATVNILTPRPLTIGRSYGALSLSGMVVERVHTVRPNVSGLYSWVNPAKTVGVLVSGSYADFRMSGDYARINQWDAAAFNVVRGSVTAPVTTSEQLNAPRQASYGVYDGGTRRSFGSLALQVAPGDRLTLSADGFYSRLDQKIGDSIVNLVFGNTIIDPTVDRNGIVTAGRYPGQAFLSAPAVAAALAGSKVAQPQDLSVIRSRDRLAESYDLGANAVWRPSDALTVTADLSHGRATGDKRFDPYVLIGNTAANDVRYAFRDGNPQVATSDPVFTDPARIRLGYSGNWGETIVDRLTEGQLSARWRPSGSPIAISVGADYQDRTKGQDNYSSRSDPYDTLTFPVDPSLLRPMTLGNDFLRGAVRPPSRQFFGYDPRRLIAWLSQPAQLDRRGQYSSSYLPTRAADGTTNCTGDCALIESDPKMPGGPLALVYDPGGSFATRERVAAGYADATLSTGVLSGNVGARVVRVDTESRGYGATVTGIVLPQGGNTYVFTYSAAGPQARAARYAAVLPSGNLTLEITPELLLRGAVGRALSRADLNDLRYGESWGGQAGWLTLALGNPALKPQFATNYDLSLEYYVSKVSYVAVAGFRKDLADLFQSRTIQATLPLAPERVFVTQTVNRARGRVDGIEVAAQYTLDDRFGWLSGLGASANYTRVTARTLGDAGACGFTGISPDSYNASGFYDDGRLELRASYNWRSRWTMACDWNGPGVDQVHAAYGQVDVALRYDLDPSFQLFADVTNLGDADSLIYGGVATRFIDRSLNYRRVNAGARLRF
ncbi:TonB-dependent receptor [Sphingomonas sp. BK580]|uniref:TonB-dependent receptor n=1 Tax=Sphingomonas sp. BK580 TaxID=2586972 RepID=UPI001616C681|nr:TonB-dependent receptor [Sphingomonas sp. BK580]MBB3692432.1 TonB-dependent receptor [Sphingomonas sp. BK580]